ncbi:MAG: HD domain-containing protein [Actinobacteria bacterium]|nr:HD domain-containing protein [Cyanobacteriota bacterium]MCL5771024.1 HD domain-containing protein [Actinomycetota bacterium]
MNDIFKSALINFPLGIIILNEKNEIIFVNEIAESIRHIKGERIIGKSVLDCHPSKIHDNVNRALSTLRSSKNSYFKRIVTDNIHSKHYENIYSSIFDKDNNFLGSMIISSDVSKKISDNHKKATNIQDLEERINDLNNKMNETFISSMDSLINALEAKDIYTSGHSKRVWDNSKKLAEYIWGISPKSKDTELAAKLHDIGKVGISEIILNKKEKLTDYEFEHIKNHVLIGGKILKPFKKLENISKIIRHHHEKYDGSGYPDGLKGDNIPEESRIITILDCYDAMTSDRPYRNAMDPEEAIIKMKPLLGNQLDPFFGETFFDLFYTGSIS